MSCKLSDASQAARSNYPDVKTAVAAAKKKISTKKILFLLEEATLSFGFIKFHVLVKFTFIEKSLGIPKKIFLLH